MTLALQPGIQIGKRGGVVAKRVTPPPFPGNRVTCCRVTRRILLRSLVSPLDFSQHQLKIGRTLPVELCYGESEASGKRITVGGSRQ